MLIPSMPHSLPSLSSPAWVLMMDGLISNWDRRHPARLKEGIGDDHRKTKKQATDNGHLAHVGVTASHLPGTVGDDNDRDDVEKLCDDPESFGHRTVERSGLSQQHVHVASIAYLSKSFVHDGLVVLSF